MILGICGSPRKQATEYILEEALSDLREMSFETELFTGRGKSIGFCQHCDYCLKNKECKFKDDMFTIYPLLRDADEFVIAMPVYNGGLSAKIKAVMARSIALSAAYKNDISGKMGKFIADCGDRAEEQELA